MATTRYTAYLTKDLDIGTAREEIVKADLADLSAAVRTRGAFGEPNEADLAWANEFTVTILETYDTDEDQTLVIEAEVTGTARAIRRLNNALENFG